jgi:F0F1-type ATP synthase assembly protein I
LPQNEKTEEYLEGFLSGLALGLIIGFIIAKAIEKKPSGIVFGRDANGNIVSINYV